MWHENAMLSSQRPAQLQSKALTGLRPARPSPGGKGPDALRWYARQCGSSRTDPLRIWATVGRRRTRTSMCYSSAFPFHAASSCAKRSPTGWAPTGATHRFFVGSPCERPSPESRVPSPESRIPSPVVPWSRGPVVPSCVDHSVSPDLHQHLILRCYPVDPFAVPA